MQNGKKKDKDAQKSLYLEIFCRFSLMFKPLFYQVYSYAPGSNDRGILFMPPDRMIGAYSFCPVCLFVCLSVCLSVVNFNLRYNI